MLPEHMRSPDPTVGANSITETGALCISSGSKAGRVPKQKRIVEDDITRDVSFYGKTFAFSLACWDTKIFWKIITSISPLLQRLLLMLILGFPEIRIMKDRFEESFIELYMENWAMIEHFSLRSITDVSLALWFIDQAVALRVQHLSYLLLSWLSCSLLWLLWESNYFTT